MLTRCSLPSVEDGEEPLGRRPLSENGARSSAVVAFLQIDKAPRLLASLASKVPSDVIPMPIARLAGFCGPTTGRPVAFSGVVLCVPEQALPEEDARILRDLGRLIPVYRIMDDPREVGLTFFERCRGTIPRVPRSEARFHFGRPVVVARLGKPDHEWLLVATNLSQGGLFIKDPHLGCDPEEPLELRFPGLTEVPTLLGRVRWVRGRGQGGVAPGYGCAFESPSDPAVRRLLTGARAALQGRCEPPQPGTGAFPARSAVERFRR
ncbi:MAG: PilZ domain-containing protein [Deferrisomatales bacterium]|nr:PilZ domain-containing protein [Deferrisomatales bacterium]